MVAFLYTNNAFTEKELSKTIPFIVISERHTEYPGINLTEEAEDCYKEIHKILKKEIEDGKTSHVH